MKERIIKLSYNYLLECVPNCNSFVPTSEQVQSLKGRLIEITNVEPSSYRFGAGFLEFKLIDDYEEDERKNH